MRVLVIVLMTVFYISSAQAANIRSQPRFNGTGGTRIFISGLIVPRDDEVFANVANQAVAPVWVLPSGPGGSVGAALAISDMIAERGYGTIVENGYNCASACALIWASGYANHAIARNSALIRFHSCANYEAGDKQGRDDMECNYIIMKHLRSYGCTDLQARWAVLYPHETTLLATKGLAASLGFNWQWINAFFPGWSDLCQARLCIAVP
jgi:hypothetical protein